MRKISIYILIFVMTFFFAKEVSALTLSPVRFELSGNPGQTIVQEMTLTNNTENTITYYSSFANFEAQGETGNPAFVEPKDGLGTWMNTAEEVTLDPKTTKIVPFSITIPTDADPGGHFAVVFWGTTVNADPGKVAIGAKTGILVLLSVNGDVKEGGGLTLFRIKDDKFWHRTLPILFEYKFRNDGSDRIKPEGKLVLRNIFYIPTQKLDGNPIQGNILPKSTRKFDITWIKNPRSKDYVESSNIVANFFDQALYQWKNFAFGLYKAELNLSYGVDNKLSTGKYLRFFVFPWQLLLLLFVIFVVIFWGGKKLLGRYNRFIIEKARAGMELPSKPSRHV